MKILFSLLFAAILSCANLTAQTWQQESKRVATPRFFDTGFGISTAIDGDWMFIGAYLDDRDAAGGDIITDAGAVYVFHRDGGVWTQTQKLVASNREGGFFGYSISLSGNYAIISAHWYSTDENDQNYINRAGAAYIFKLIGSTWSQIKKIDASDRLTDHYEDFFGYSVSISGDYAVVGAFGDKTAESQPNMEDAGSAYVFYNNNDAWTEIQKLTPSDRQSGDNFGGSVAISGDYLIVSASHQDLNTTGTDYIENSGAAYIYHNNSGTWELHQKLISSNRASEDWFGSAVAIHDNVAVCTAQQEDEDESDQNAVSNAGAAYVFSLNGGEWTQEAKLVSSDRDAGDMLGRFAAITDNYICITSEKEKEDAAGLNPLTDAGAAYIYTNESGNWQFQTKVVASDRAISDNFGYGAAIDGATLAVGAYAEDHDVNGANGLSASGSAYLYTMCANAGVDVVNACTDYTWIDGITYIESNQTATWTLTNAAGCDSVVTLDLTIGVPTSGTDVQFACESFTWINGITYTESHQTLTWLTNAAGCDSLVTLDLTIGVPTSGTDVQFACESFTWIDGITYTESNQTATWTLTNAAGCDSVVTLNLTLSTAIFVDSSATAYETYEWRGQTYVQSGYYADTIEVGGLCDTIYTLNLIIEREELPNYVDTTALVGWWPLDGDVRDYSMHQNDGQNLDVTYTVNHNQANESAGLFAGWYSWIDLGDQEILNPGLSDYTISAWVKTSNCDYQRIFSKGSSGGYQPGVVLMIYNDGKAALVYTATSGSFNEQRINSNSSICDDAWHHVAGVIERNGTLKLFVDGVLQNEQLDISGSAGVDVGAGSYHAAIGASYSHYGEAGNLSEFFAGSLDDIGVWKRSLDACEISDLFHLTPRDTSIVATACLSYTAPDGAVYTADGDYTAVIPTTNGCDSTISVHLTLGEQITYTQNVTACLTYTWIDGITYTENNNTAVHLIESTSGCDTMFYLNLTIQQSPVITSLSPSSISHNSATLSWELTSDCSDETKVRYRKVGDVNWKFISTQNNSLNLSNLSVNTNYEYRVDLRKAGNSIYLSPLANFTTECTIPEKPSGLNVLASAGTATLSWNDKSGCSNNSKVRYRIPGYTGWKYLTGSADSCVLTNLIPGTEYQWRVMLNNQYGNSAISDIASFTTTCDGLLPRPEELQSVGNDATSVWVNWGVGPCPEGATVRYRIVGTTAWSYHTVNGNNSSTLLNGLVSGSQYEWRVVTRLNDGTISPVSAVAYFETPSVRLANPSESGISHETSVFPNPFSQEISVAFSGNSGDITLIEITDLQGRNVTTAYRGVAHDGENMFRISETQGLAPGIYILHMICGETETRKLVTKN